MFQSTTRQLFAGRQGQRLFTRAWSSSTPHAFTRQVAFQRHGLVSAVRSMSKKASPAYKNLSVEIQDNIAIISLDCADSKVNTLSRALLPEVEAVVQEVESNPGVTAAIFTSAKSGNFIAGADIQMLNACKTQEEVRDVSVSGQKILQRIASSKKPYVAAIDGQCLGGGLEVALACHYRIAATSPKTVMALPEVMLGLLPGAGGTQRLPKLVGVQASLDMMLTGKNIRPAKARKMGLVDQVADPNALRHAALQAAKGLAAKTLKPKRDTGLVDKIINSTGRTLDFVFDKAGEMVAKKTGGHYPAPKKILEATKIGLVTPSKGYAAEATKFSELAMTPESKALMSIFFAQTSLKKNRFGVPVKPIKKIAVLGAGLMGAGVVQVSAQKALHTTLMYDVNEESLARGQKQIYENLNRGVKRRAMTVMERDIIRSRVVNVTPNTPNLAEHMKDVDMIIEAVPENLKLKHEVLSLFEKMVSKDCIIASNTSALPIGDIAKGIARPENLIGMHYFSPVDKMPLLEIITTDQTSEAAKAAAVDVGLKQGKTVIVVKDGPGFYTTRILAPMMSESVSIAMEGVELGYLDQALRKFGFPVGPITLVDEVGIDVGKHVSESMERSFGERMASSDMAVMDEMIAKGFLGRKSNKGFFLYDKPSGFKLPKFLGGKSGKQLNPDAVELIKSKAKSPTSNMKLSEIQDRMVLRFVNEAVLCLQEGILPNATEGDIGAIFGLGFPPFLGGPFRYVDRVGAGNVVERLDSLQTKYGIRFTAAELLRKHAQDGTKFHTSK